MTVRVRFFAGLVPIVGEKSIEMALPAGATVGTLRDQLVVQYPVLEPFMTTYVCAVAEEMREPEYALHDGDLVDVIPPIAGG
jgi:molybdopterin converting factor small subunit